MSCLGLKCIGRVLRILIIVIFFLHVNVFLCLSFCLELWLDNDVVTTLVILFGPLNTTITTVICINYVGEFYDEIQSWEIAYISWSAFCFIGILIQETWVCCSKSKTRDQISQEFDSYLLAPFGVKASKVGSSGWWSLPLVSCAPAIVCGYLANYMLQERFELECNELYFGISDICEDDVCCIVISSHDDWINFITKLASSIIAGWGIVKSIGFFITKYDDDIEEHKENTETANIIFTNI